MIFTDAIYQRLNQATESEQNRYWEWVGGYHDGPKNIALKFGPPTLFRPFQIPTRIHPAETCLG